MNNLKTFVKTYCHLQKALRGHSSATATDYVQSPEKRRFDEEMALLRRQLDAQVNKINQFQRENRQLRAQVRQLENNRNREPPHFPMEEDNENFNRAQDCCTIL